MAIIYTSTPGLAFQVEEEHEDIIKDLEQIRENNENFFEVKTGYSYIPFVEVTSVMPVPEAEGATRTAALSVKVESVVAVGA